MHSKSGYKAKKNYKKMSKILQNVKDALLLRCIQGKNTLQMHSKSGYKAEKNYKKMSKILQINQNRLLLRCIQGFWIHSALKNEYILKEA